MCRIDLTIDTGADRPHLVRSVMPNTFDDGLYSHIIEAAIYRTKLIPSHKKMSSRPFLRKLDACLTFLKRNQMNITETFEAKPILHFISLIDFLERAKLLHRRKSKNYGRIHTIIEC